MRKRILRRVMIGVLLVVLTGCASLQVQARVSSCQQMVMNRFLPINRIPRKERQALLALDKLSPGSIVPAKTGVWPCRYVPPPCQWVGVSCASRHVTELSVGSKNLAGEIPPELGNLSQLVVLYLYEGQLSGEIPSELGNLSQLRVLSLVNNQLSGEIPGELGNLSQLHELWLMDNQLTGEIPAELGYLPQLEVLMLGGNQLSGSIPAELGYLSQLWALNLADNQLSGEIPAELGNLTQLWTLALNGNQLSGPIPDNLSEISIQILYLSNNELCVPQTVEFEMWIADIGDDDLEEVLYCE